MDHLERHHPHSCIPHPHIHHPHIPHPHILHHRHADKVVKGGEIAASIAVQQGAEQGEKHGQGETKANSNDVAIFGTQVTLCASSQEGYLYSNNKQISLQSDSKGSEWLLTPKGKNSSIVCIRDKEYNFISIQNNGKVLLTPDASDSIWFSAEEKDSISFKNTRQGFLAVDSNGNLTSSSCQDDSTWFSQKVIKEVPYVA